VITSATDFPLVAAGACRVGGTAPGREIGSSELVRSWLRSDELDRRDQPFQ
jgi:hypothetical protein